jgi:quercetin dioxygenase-like cupin family protein
MVHGNEGRMIMGVVHKKKPGAYDWEGIDIVSLDKPGVKDISKRILVGPNEQAPGIAMRYFEVQPGGHSPDESHPEIHEVIVLKGSGQVFLDGEYHDIVEGDVVYVGPNERHQFLAAPDEGMGFICVAPKP